MLVEDFGDQFEAEIDWIINVHACVWFLLLFVILHVRQQLWTVNWINLLMLCYTLCRFAFHNMVMLVVTFGQQFETEIDWITRFQFFSWILLSLTCLLSWLQIWTVKLIKLLMCCCTVCRLDFLQYGHVGGFRWSIWGRTWVNHTFHYSHLVFAEIVGLQFWQPLWTMRLIHLLMLCCTACKFEVLWCGHVGGGCWWSIWNRNWANPTFLSFRLVLVEIDDFALLTTNMDRQVNQIVNVLLYRVQIWVPMMWSCWWLILVIHLMPKSNASFVSSFAFGSCWVLQACIYDNQYGSSMWSKS